MHRNRSFKSFVLLAGFAACVGFTASATAKTENNVSIDLGNTAAVTGLFSFPNNDMPDSLAQTIQLYLQQSMQRDKLTGVGVSVGADGSGNYAAVFSGAGLPANYPARITQFLQIGNEGVTAQGQMQKDGKWDGKDWRLFLPLGLAMDDQKSVQLLHFPPDTSLTLQDYLNSATSRRWESLLELNGASAADVTLYERIVDIAPIAAPASAGNSLAAAYGYFKSYAFDMLNYSVQPQPASKPLPVVAYGGPVRQWVQDNLKAKLPVLGTAYVQVGKTTKVPFLGANHPSYIWYAAKQSRTLALRTMRDDLASACWQVKTAADPGQDITAVVKQCTAYWDLRDEQVCELTEIQAYDKTPEEAKQICATSAKARLRAARKLTMHQIEKFEGQAPRHIFAR